MRSEKLGIKESASLTDFKPLRRLTPFPPPLSGINPSTAFGGPPPLSEEAINRDSFKICKGVNKGSPERGAGKP